MKVPMPTPLDSLTVALFVPTAPAQGALALWKKSFKQDPLGFNQVAGGGTQANGTVGGYSVAVLSQPTRIDLNLGGISSPAGEPPTMPDAGEAIKFALSKVKLLMPAKVDRVALVLQSSSEMTNVLAAVESVKAKVPGLNAPTGATDLWYQTAVPRVSKVIQGLNLTLAARWHTGLRNLIQLNLGNEPSLRTQGPPTPLCITYLDVFNTEPSGLFAKRAFEVLEELADYAQATLSSGYGSLV